MSINQYTFHHCIGKGNFGDVYKATNTENNRLVAIKVINLDEANEEIKVLIQEIQFLSRLKSPYITNYFETFINEMSMFIVMEYCGGGSCADLLRYYKKLPEDIVACIIRDVLKGLNYLHSEKKVHRDIKSANILLTNKGEVKLADFGVSGQITFTQLKRNTFVGTPFWMAPEVITRRKHGGYNEKADIWSTGITTIELITGSPPFAQFDPMKILFEIPKNKPPVLTGSGYSENIKDFVRYCLLKDPRKRPSCSKLLHHRFITSIKSSADLIKLIEKKNEWLELSNKVGRKPRHEIFKKQENRNSIKWDFNTFKSFHSSQMQQTLLNLPSGDLGNDVDEISQNVSRIAVKSPIGSFRSKMDSQTPKIQDGKNCPILPIKKVKLIESNSCLPDPATPQKSYSQSPVLPQRNTTQLLPLSEAGAYQYDPEISRGDVLFYCLEQVYVRGKSSSTKKTVHDLIRNLLEYEGRQPGLCEALVEEILQFRQN